MRTDLPFIDEHAIRIAAPPERVWEALGRHVETSLRRAEGHALVGLLGPRPRAGFAIAESRPVTSLTLVGRHRFSRYALAFELADADGGTTQLRARTFAAFPGVHGRVYRALIIGTRAHVLATGHILRSVRRLSLDRRSPAGPGEEHGHRGSRHRPRERRDESRRFRG